MLYEMVSGQRAFQGDSAIETLSAILKHDPPDLSATTTMISSPLASVIQHCLEKERDQRFQSARDLAFALRRLSGPSTSSLVALPPASPSRRKLWIAGAMAAIILLSTAVATYVRWPGDVESQPTFRQLTFRRGHIDTARFGPDGQTVISSASWEGKPSEMASTRLDTAESTVLPLAGASLSSVSRAGDVAVIAKENVLAQVPIGGSGMRDLLDLVHAADWARDGTLAVIRHDGPRMWVEYPVRKSIYEPVTSINSLRVSPDGGSVAILEQEAFGGGTEWLSILDRAGTVISRSQKWATSTHAGLAWTPDGREVWFTAADVGGRSAVHAMTRDGRQRVVHRSTGSVSIQDIAPDGRALLVTDSVRSEMSLVDTNLAGERDLTWRDWSRPFALSSDGRMLAFGAGGRTGTGTLRGFIRPTDGSAAVQISEKGNPIALSPDGKWAITSAPGTNLALVPTGVGESRALDPGQITNFSTMAAWLGDGQRIVFIANEQAKPTRVFLQNVSGGPPDAFTAEGTQGPLAVSPDSTLLVARGPGGQLWKFPVDRSAPTVLSGSSRGDRPLAWSADGRSVWVWNRTTTPAQIFRIELISGRRIHWRDVPFPDPAAMKLDTLRLVMSADGTKFVYGYTKHLSELYVAEGLK